MTANVNARMQLAGQKLHNMDVYIREEDLTVDDFIDVLIGNRRYVNCLYVYNKIDTISMEEVDRIARQPHSVVISCELGLNLDGLKKAIWEVSGASLTAQAACLSLMTGSNSGCCAYIRNPEGRLWILQIL